MIKYKGNKTIVTASLKDLIKALISLDNAQVQVSRKWVDSVNLVLGGEPPEEDYEEPVKTQKIPFTRL